MLPDHRHRGRDRLPVGPPRLDEPDTDLCGWRAHPEREPLPRRMVLLWALALVVAFGVLGWRYLGCTARDATNWALTDYVREKVTTTQ